MGCWASSSDSGETHFVVGDEKHIVDRHAGDKVDRKPAQNIIPSDHFVVCDHICHVVNVRSAKVHKHVEDEVAANSDIATRFSIPRCFVHNYRPTEPDIEMYSRIHQAG